MLPNGEWEKVPVGVSSCMPAMSRFWSSKGEIFSRLLVKIVPQFLHLLQDLPYVTDAVIKTRYAMAYLA